ncbi:MAG TPA: hypothetical protein VHP11_10080, partial [Tepidisphaeraceae bacterium]|nr:hypothetical protein [Tepidisphaeraceae bacterium]
MLGLVMCRVLILGQMFLPFGAPADQGNAAPATQPTTQATTQPAGEMAASTEAFLRELATGSKQLTLQEVLDPEFWRRLLLQLAMEMISLVPRVMVA